MRVQPRAIKAFDVGDRARTPWIFKKSAFRRYLPDSKKILDKCFEFDWSYITSHVENKLIKGEEELKIVKKVLRENYNLLRDAYKCNAGHDSDGDVMKMGPLSTTRLL